MVLRYNIRVTGKVQGVFFRESTRRKALEINVSGFVRNESDGAVYIEAEGNEAQLAELVSWCQRGPERAEVIAVKVEPAPVNNHRGFEIRR